MTGDGRFVYSYWTVRASKDPRLAVGLIGLGNMGTAIAERLLDAGYELVVQQPHAREGRGARGARRPRSPRRPRSSPRRSTSSSPRSRTTRRSRPSRRVGRRGAAGHRPRRHEHGLAGRLGARGGARSRRRVGRVPSRARQRQSDRRARREPRASSSPGARDASNEVEPVLLAIGPTIHHVGDGEQARVVKLAINLMIAVLAQAMSEALVLGEAAGVVARALLEVMGNSAVGAPFVKYKTEPLLRDDYLGDVHDGAHGEGHRPRARRGRRGRRRAAAGREMKALLRAAIEAGYADDDFIALFLHLRRASGLDAGPAADEASSSRTGGGAVTMRSRATARPTPRGRSTGSSGSTSRACGRTGSIARRPRSRPPTSGRCCCSTRTTSGTSRARTSASGRGTRTPGSPSFRAARTRSSGTSARRPATISCSLRGSRRRTSAPASRRCAARCPSRPGFPDRLGERIAHELRERGLQDEPLGVDMADLVTIEALQRAGVHVTDGSRVLLEARTIKTPQEIALLDQSAGLVDAVYEEIYRMLRPGVYEHEIVGARAPAALRDGLGAGRGGQRRLRRPLQPAPARLLGPPPASGRPGVLRHHPLVHGLPDVLLPHVQRRRRQPRAARCVQAVPRVARRGDRARLARA